MMALVQNFPFMSIILSLFSGPLCSVLDGKRAKRVNTAVIIVIGFMSACVLGYVSGSGEPFIYRMGHFPAPWGNEIRVGVLEAFMAVFFCIIMLLCMVGGARERLWQIEESKQNLYYIMVNLLLCSLLALIYTNDLFTAYVFVEINTISACGLIMIRQNGRTIEAATRYMIMSLLGSGLLLLGICFLYSVTGHLLMSNIRQQVELLASSGEYRIPLMVSLVLMSVGLAIKSALYPFHAWLPDAYGYSTVSSAAILSSLVSKGYIFLLIKIFYRVIGFEIICSSKVIHILFVFGVMGMIMGSVSAIKEESIRRMIAYSSVAQIGYIYMGFGLGTEIGVVASIYHVLSHAATKSLLFVAASGLTDASGGSVRYEELHGAGFRHKLAGAAFTVGALSMVGLPMFSGFISKLLFSQAAMGHEYKMLITLIALAVSTILNAVYFMKTVIRIYTPAAQDGKAVQGREDGQSREKGLSVEPGQSRERERSVEPGQSQEKGLSVEPGQSREKGLSVEPGQSRERGRSVEPGQSREKGLSGEPGQSRERGRSKEAGMGRKKEQDGEYGESRVIHMREQPGKSVALICFVILNLILGLNSEPVIHMIEAGLEMFR